jgi:hypothetical protein
MAVKCGLSEIQFRQKSSCEIVFSSPHAKLAGNPLCFASFAKLPPQLALNFSPHFDYVWRSDKIWRLVATRTAELPSNPFPACPDLCLT